MKRETIGQLMGFFVVCVIGTPLCQAESSNTQSRSWVDNVSISSKGFLRYSQELTEARGGFYEFAVDRIYLTFQWKMWEKAIAKYTLEGGDLREKNYTTAPVGGGTVSSNDNGYFDVASKHFYFELQDVLYPSFFMRFGLTDLPWVPYDDGLWEYRVQGTNFSDRSGYLTSTDLGVAVGGGLGGYGSWQANIANGEGWKAREIGKNKEAHARLTINPLAGLEGIAANIFVTTFGAIGAYDDTSPSTKNRVIFQVGYKEKEKLTLVGEYLMARDRTTKMTARHPSLTEPTNRATDSVSTGRGFSLFGVFNASFIAGGDTAKSYELFLRWDHLDPDIEIAENTLDRAIGGLAYRWNENILTLVGYEMVKYSTNSSATDEQRVYVNAELKL